MFSEELLETDNVLSFIKKLPQLLSDRPHLLLATIGIGFEITDQELKAIQKYQ